LYHNRFRKKGSARFDNENSPSLRGASRAPFVSRCYWHCVI
jgi:hypothetical protein